MAPRSRIRRVARWLVVLSLAWLVSGWAASYAMTRRWTERRPEPTPAGFVAVRLRTDDGLSIGAFRSEHPHPRAAVVLVHGNGSSRSALVDDARRLHGLGCTTLPITVRAHGDSDGTHNDIGFHARHDVTAAVAHLRARNPSVPIVVLGKSLGAAAALFAAPSLGRKVQGYLLIAPYADLAVAVRRRTRRYLPWPLDALAYGALRAASPLTMPDLPRIRPELAARAMPRDVPTWIVAGGADDRAPPSDARRIAAPLHRARVVVIPDLQHEALVLLGDDPIYLDTLTGFLDVVAPRP